MLKAKLEHKLKTNETAHIQEDSHKKKSVRLKMLIEYKTHYAVHALMTDCLSQAL